VKLTREMMKKKIKEALDQTWSDRVDHGELKALQRYNVASLVFEGIAKQQ
jgi:hypothetical protein